LTIIYKYGRINPVLNLAEAEAEAEAEKIPLGKSKHKLL